jgi:hypothetical protein
MFASGGNISRSGATSFCTQRQKDAKTPPKTNGFWISFCLIAAAVQKGSASDSLYDEMRRSKSRVIHSCGFQRTPTAQKNVPQFHTRSHQGGQLCP